MSSSKLSMSNISGKTKHSALVDKLFQSGPSSLKHIKEKEEFKFRRSLAFAGLVCFISKDKKMIRQRVEISVLINRFLVIIDSESMKGVKTPEITTAFFFPLLSEIQEYFSPILLSSLDFTISDGFNSFHVLTLEYPVGDIAEQLTSYGEISYNKFNREATLKPTGSLSLITFTKPNHSKGDTIRLRENNYSIRVVKFTSEYINRVDAVFLMVKKEELGVINNGFLMSEDGVFIGTYRNETLTYQEMLEEMALNTSASIRSKMRGLNDKAPLLFLKVQRLSNTVCDEFNKTLKEIEAGEKKLPGKIFDYDVEP